MKPKLLLVAILYCYSIQANCLLKKVSIDQRTKSSQVIINGKITNQHSCWNADRSSIYTVSSVEVIDYLKGNAPANVEIVTPGGELDGKLLVVEPNADLKTGAMGIFFLTENTVGLDYASKAKKYEIYSLAQGFIEQDQYTNIYKDPFDEYQNIVAVASLIEKSTGVSFKISNQSSNRLAVNNTANSDGTPILFSPSRISAGTGSVLTITGSGFGTRTGSATIQFRDANSTSFTTYSNIPDSSYIVSWTNTEIKVIVPGASINRQGGAGSGLVNIIHSSGAIIPSTNPITISYNQFEYKKRRVVLINQNSLGGYTFTLNTNFSNNTIAKASYLRALDQWECKSGVNVTISPSTTANICSNQIDNLNTISFADASCQIPAGTLGVTYSSYSVCTGSPIIPDGIDMVFNGASNFYYETGAPASNLYDFETVVLHELGHAFGQGHNSDGNEIMFPSISNGTAKRTLNPYTDLENIIDVVTRSSTVSACGYLKHIPLNTPCVSRVTAISASFTTDKAVGCAPLTVQFTDNSIGNPTQWRWDIDNNGYTDYTSQNTTHTFTKAGTYNVKLVAYSSNSNDSIVKMADIIVAPTLKASIEVGQHVSCYGGNNGNLVASPTGGNGSYVYTWNNSQTSSTANNLIAGNYSVSIKDGYNCTAAATKAITQPEQIQLNITTQAVNTNEYTAILDLRGGIAPFTYLLNNSIVSPTNYRINNLVAGDYSVVVKDINNCTQNATFSASAPTAVIDVEKTIDALNIYPNPATDNVNINLSLKDYQDVQVELFNISGQAIFQEKYENIKDKQTNIDLSMLSNGTYILKFGFAEGSTFRKIQVNR